MGKAKLFIVAAVLFASFTAIGIYAVKSSGYMDVSELLKLNRPAKVIVKGMLENLYYDPSSRKLYLVLSGYNGGSVVAIIDANYIEKKYGPIQYLKWDKNNIVLEGIYDPATRTLRVTNVLSGCHSSYSEPAAPRT